VTFVDRHRGPFRFLVGRFHPDRKLGKQHTSELLKGTVESQDTFTEAKALLTDKRDTIDSVSVWCEKDEQFIGTITLRNVDKLLEQSYIDEEVA
jgi:hypothetical protein